MRDEDRMAALPVEMQEWLGELTPERHAVIIARMGKVIEDRVGSWDDNTDPVLIEEVWIDVVGNMFLSDLRDEWVEKGFVELTGVADDGQYVFIITDLGREAGL